MKSLLIILAFIVLILIEIYLARKLVESLVNLWIAIFNKNKPPYHEGMVFNKETKKLESDNSKILPY